MSRYSGSSPLARGTRPRCRSGHRITRFIPARAGNTTPPQARDGVSPVHPRSRGEHADRVASQYLRGGSSPLARGTHDAVPKGGNDRRFIPARAGNTSAFRRSGAPAPVHPRSRGEHPAGVRRAGGVTGSSPLARGTHGGEGRADGRGRFIPARAGNTHQTARQRGWPTVHPRSRGEHSMPDSPASAAIGSSPLARGTLDRLLCDRVTGRFIPARAGNTADGGRGGWTGPVHPRSRGEHSPHGCVAGGEDGSSPLARGTLRGARLRHRRARFIPARAGNTRTTGAGAAAVPVHPRSRGEHLARSS